MKEFDLDDIKENFFEHTKLLRDITNTSTRTISNNTRLTYKKLKKYEIEKLMPDRKVLLTYADYFYVSTDFLLGLIDNYDLSNVKPFIPTPDYFRANIGGKEFDSYGPHYDTCSHTLKYLREKAKLTRAKLAKLLNIPANIISKWESDFTYDSCPPIEYLIKLSDFYRVTLDYLLGRTMCYNELVINNEEPYLSEQELTAGAKLSRKVNITPIEHEMLYQFRRLGKKHGEPTQRGIIEMIEKMCN